jgi:hypothetical protein
VLHFFQKRRPPVEHGVARDIDKEVAAGDEPQVAVLEDVINEQLARAQLLLALASSFIGIVVAILLNRWQPLGLWRVSQPDHQIDRADRGQNARHIECRSPAQQHRGVRGNHADQSAPHILREIPEPEDRAPLADAVPVAERAPAWRPSHALRQPVHRPERQVRWITACRAKSKVARGRQQQSQRHEVPRIAAVRE